MTTSTAFLSLEAELEILADKLEAWARDDQRAAAHSISKEMAQYWRGQCDAWTAMARHIRQVLDEKAAVPGDFNAQYQNYDYVMSWPGAGASFPMTAAPDSLWMRLEAIANSYEDEEHPEAMAIREAQRRLV